MITTLFQVTKARKRCNISGDKRREGDLQAPGKKATLQPDKIAIPEMAQLGSEVFITKISLHTHV